MSDLQIYSFVTLARAIEHKTATVTVNIPAGTRGVIVHVHSHNGFEVKFEEPTFAVVTVSGDDLASL